MTVEEILDTLDERTTLAATMWAEGRGDWREGNSSVEERIAIGCVVRNRLHQHKRFKADVPTYRAVCLARAQFSCWSPIGGAENYRALMAALDGAFARPPRIDMLFAESLYLADGLIAGVILDRTGGATNYYAPHAMKPVGRVPKDALGRSTRRIGDQLFYIS